MAYTLKAGQGSLHVDSSDKKIDRSGSAVCACPNCGHEFGVWIDGWIKAGRDGKPPWLSLAIKPKDAPKAQYIPAMVVPASPALQSKPRTEAEQASHMAIDQDDIPF